MRTVKAGTVLDVVQQYGTDIDRMCLCEIALYREMGVSSPQLEAVMIDSVKDRNDIRKTLKEKAQPEIEPDSVVDLIGTDMSQWPNDVQTIRRYKDLRETFKQLTQLPNKSLVRTPQHFYKNRFVMALWLMFRAGYSYGRQVMNERGAGRLQYFIIGKRGEKNSYSFADDPHRHISLALAMQEQRRLADKHKGTMFGVFSLVSTRKQAVSENEVPKPDVNQTIEPGSSGWHGF